MASESLQHDRYAVTKKEWSELQDLASALNAFADKFAHELDGAGEGVLETLLLIQKPLDRLVNVLSVRFWQEEDERRKLEGDEESES